MFFIHNALEKFKDVTLPGYFGFVDQETLGMKITLLSYFIVFVNLRFQNVFRTH